FGKNIIPNMLNDGEVMMAYEFDDYWKDVGTIDSLWQANMELLGEESPIKLNDPSWKIYARNPNAQPHYVADGAVIKDSLITEGASIYGTVEHSVLFHGCRIGKGAIVRDSVILPDAVIAEGAVVQYSIVGQEAVIGKNATVGAPKETCDSGAIAVVGDTVRVGENAQVAPGEMIGENRE
ncbi:MAG: glucose-1-phosphate adenylyltransferase, partial [Firmicutes bacterium]|nr:glucose-1-phosphate adenylyltransferase [Bacillota bacterium]